jgi:DNA-binding NarL/FixJ family response regulator
MSKIRVILIDDQALVRAGLAALLRSLPGITLVAEFADAISALAKMDAQVDAQTAPQIDIQVDVIISDIRMPGMSGIALTQSLRQRRMSTPVLLLTTFEDPSLFLQARKAGAQGFLLKDTSPEILLEAILTLSQGGTLFEPKAINTLGAIPESEKPSGQLELSLREIEILRLMAGGYANKEIAGALHLAEGTVKNYVSEIMAKLDCADRTRAVLKAISQKLI